MSQLTMASKSAANCLDVHQCQLTRNRSTTAVVNFQREERLTMTSHLVLIIDLYPYIPSDGSLHVLDSVTAFAKCHLLMNEKNGLTVIGSLLDHSWCLYPRGVEPKAPTDGQLESLYEVSQQIGEGLKIVVRQARESITKSSIRKSESLISVALSLALCRINRYKDDFSSSRIAILSMTSDESCHMSSQYMNFMNCFFTAQKLDVIIDVVTANMAGSSSEGSILRQGCDITGGFYLGISHIEAMLQYLMWVLLPSSETRSKLVLPKQSALGSKAACFCHKSLINIGFVCSVCLSIFCSFSPICSSCNTIFKLGPLPSPFKNNRNPSAPRPTQSIN